MDTDQMHPTKLACIFSVCLAFPMGAFAQQLGIPFQAVMSGAEAVPASSFPFGISACARLSLNGTNLLFRFAGWPAGSIEIRGPARRGTNGPLLYATSPNLGASARTDYCDIAAWPFFEPFGEPLHPIGLALGRLPLSSQQIDYLMEELLYINFIADGWFLDQQFNTRGQITLLDSDSDGVPDFRDQCANTSLGSLINSDGCSIEQLCPCEAPWRNHGEFVTRMQSVLKDFSEAGLITIAQQRELFRAAAESDCGKVSRSKIPAP